ncbi:hypothetical protein D4R51_01320 [bacterium]|nr:MAG: hypothetical protein D4R51_01320 [bacterium]
MTFRRELPFFQILLGLFQEFDHDKEIEQAVPAAWNLQPGDHLEYEVGQNIDGIAEVVSVGAQEGEDVRCKFKKIS